MWPWRRGNEQYSHDLHNATINARAAAARQREHVDKLADEAWRAMGGREE